LLLLPFAAFASGGYDPIALLWQIPFFLLAFVIFWGVLLAGLILYITGIVRLVMGKSFLLPYLWAKIVISLFALFVIYLEYTLKEIPWMLFTLILLPAVIYSVRFLLQKTGKTEMGTNTIKYYSQTVRQAATLSNLEKIVRALFSEHKYLTAFIIGLQVFWWAAIMFMLFFTGPYERGLFRWLFWRGGEGFIIFGYLLSVIFIMISSAWGIYHAFKHNYKRYKYIYPLLFLLNFPVSLVWFAIFGGSHSV